jgi:hypothetical protein
MKLLDKVQGCDNLLLGQGHHASQGAVIGEYGAMAE